MGKKHPQISNTGAESKTLEGMDERVVPTSAGLFQAV